MFNNLIICFYYLSGILKETENSGFKISKTVITIHTNEIFSKSKMTQKIKKYMYTNHSM